MIVVADSSPLIVLHAIDQIDLLPRLFQTVAIPDAVVAELSGTRRTPALRKWMASPPSWLRSRDPKDVRPIRGLHSGEIAAIALALEIKPQFILLDDRAAFKAAIKRKLPAIGTVRVLEIAAERSLVKLRQAFTALKKTDFWISHKLLDERLRLFEKEIKGS